RLQARGEFGGGELTADFGRDIGNPAVGKILTDQQQARKKHDRLHFSAEGGQLAPISPAAGMGRKEPWKKRRYPAGRTQRRNEERNGHTCRPGACASHTLCYSLGA